MMLGSSPNEANWKLTGDWGTDRGDDISVRGTLDMNGKKISGSWSVHNKACNVHCRSIVGRGRFYAQGYTSVNICANNPIGLSLICEQTTGEGVVRFNSTAEGGFNSNEGHIHLHESFEYYPILNSGSVNYLTGCGLVQLSGNSLTLTGDYSNIGTIHVHWVDWNYRPEKNFRGTLQGPGNLICSGATHLNCSNSSLSSLTVQNKLLIGWQATGSIRASTVSTYSWLGIGDNNRGNGTLTCDNLTFSGGQIKVGCYHDSAQGRLTCNGTLTHANGDLSLGCERTSNSGTGYVSTQNYSLQKGNIYIGCSPSSNSSIGYLTIDNNMTTNSGTYVHIGNGSGRGQLTVGNLLTLNGTLNCNNLINPQSSLTVGGLTGNGTLNLLGGHTLTITRGIGQIFSGLLTGTGRVIKSGSETQIFSNPGNSYSGGTTINTGTLGGFVGSGALTINYGGTYRLSTTISGNSGGFTTTWSALIGNGTIDSANGTLTINGGDQKYTGKIIGNGILKRTNNGLFELNCSSGTLSQFIVENGTVNFARNGTARLTTGSLSVSGNSRFVCGDGAWYSSNAVMMCSLVSFSGGSFVVASYNGTGTFNCGQGNVAMSGGVMYIGSEVNGGYSSSGNGTLLAGNFSLTGGTINLGTTNSSSSLGTLTIGNNITTSPGTYVHIGNGSGRGQLTVGGILTLNGTLNCNNLINPQSSLTVGGLTGNGILNLLGGHILTITGEVEKIFTGRIDGTGTLEIKGNNIGLNCLNGSRVRQINVRGKTVIGWRNGAGNLSITEGIDIQAWFGVGDNNGARGTVSCNNITFNRGTLTVGSYYSNAQGTLTCNGTLVQSAGNLSAGCNGGEAEGTGFINIRDYNLNGGSAYLGFAPSAYSKGTLTIGNNMTTNYGTYVYIGNGSGKGKLTVTNTLTLNGTLTCNNLMDQNSLMVGGLTGNGTLDLENNNTITVNGAISRFTGTITGAGIFNRTSANNFGLNCSSGNLYKLVVNSSTVNFAWKATANLTTTELVVGGSARFVCGDGENQWSDGTLNCSLVSFSGGSFAIGSYSGTGVLNCTKGNGAFNMSGGNLLIGTENNTPGNGTLNAKTFYCTAGNIGIGTFNSAIGVLTVSDYMIMNTGLTIGSGSGRGRLTVGGTLTLNGTLTCNNLIDQNSLMVGGLTGNGTLNFPNNTLTINPGTEQTFTRLLTGTGKVVKNGPGNQVFSGLNTYTGGTTIYAGILAGHVGSGTLTVNSPGTYRLATSLNGSDSLNVNWTTLLGTGTIDLVQGTLILSGAGGTPQDFSGKIIGSGNLTRTHVSEWRLNCSAGNLKNLTVTSSNITLAMGKTASLTATNLTLNGNGIFRCGYSTSGNGTLVCPNISLVLGYLTIGANQNTKASLTTTSMDQTGGFFSIGCEVEGSQGNGSASIKTLKLNGGAIYLGAANVNTSVGSLTAETMNVITGTVKVGNGQGRGNLIVTNNLTLDGTLTAANAPRLEVGGLVGTGTLNLQENTRLIVVNTTTAATFSGTTTFSKQGSLTVQKAQNFNFKASSTLYDLRIDNHVILGSGTESTLTCLTGTLASGKLTVGFNSFSSNLTSTHFTASAGTTLNIAQGGIGNVTVIGNATIANGVIGSENGTGTLSVPNGTITHPHASTAISVGAGSGSTGTIHCASFSQTAGDTNIGDRGTGLLKCTNTLTLSGTLRIGKASGTANPLQGKGTVTCLNFESKPGSYIITGGNDAELGELVVSSLFTHNGTLLCDRLINPNAFSVAALAGDGVLILNNNCTLLITQGNDRYFSGKLEGDGILNICTTGSWPNINTQEGSIVSTLNINCSGGSYPGLKLGCNGVGALTCQTCALQSGTLWVGGENSFSSGKLQINSDFVCGPQFLSGHRGATGLIRVNGNVTLASGLVGYETGKGTLTVTGDIDHTALSGSKIVYESQEVFLIGQGNGGTGNVNCSNFHHRTGTLSLGVAGGMGTLNCSGTLIYSAGTFNIGNDGAANSKGSVSCTDMQINSGQILTLGFLNKGQGSLDVSGILTHTGTIISHSVGSFSVGTLTGTEGTISLNNQTTLTIKNGQNQSYNGTISGDGILRKSEAGAQVLLKANTYTRLTQIEAGTLCGEISFSSPLNIVAPGVFRLALNTSGPTGGLTRTLSAPLTGTGYFDLVDGALTIGVSSAFNGLFRNTNTTPSKLVLTLAGNDVQFDAGPQVHPMIGLIQMAPFVPNSSNRQNMITGLFPSAYWSGNSGSGIDAKRSVSFRGLEGGTCHLTGQGTLTLTEGYLDSLKISKIYYRWSFLNTPQFTGSITKQGAGLQILQWPGPSASPTHTRETRVEGGILAGPLSPQAPLFIGNGAAYHITYYQNASNLTEITSQTVAGLCGEGTLEIGHALNAQVTFSSSVALGEQNFSGQLKTLGTFTKTGNGVQKISADQDLFKGNFEVNEGTLYVAQLDTPGFIKMMPRTFYHMTGNQTVASIESPNGDPTFNLHNYVLSISGNSKVFFGNITDDSLQGSLILLDQTQKINSLDGSRVGSLHIKKGTFYLGDNAPGYLQNKDTRIDQGSHFILGSGAAAFGKLTSETLSIAGILDLAPTSSHAVGTLKSRLGTLEASGIINVGNGNGQGAFEIESLFTLEGSLICNTTTNRVDALKVGSLTGSGNIQLKKNLLLIAGDGQNQTFTGTFAPGGTLRRTHASDWGLNTVASTQEIDELDLDGGTIRIGWNALGTFRSRSVTLKNSGLLSVGTNGNGTLFCNTLTSQGTLDIGDHGIGSIQGSGTITQKDGMWNMGIHAGQGTLTCPTLMLQQGQFAASLLPDSTASITTNDLFIQDTLTCFSAGLKAQISVQNVLTCDAKSVLLDCQSNPKIGGLAGNGAITLQGSTCLDITNGLGQTYFGTLLGTGTVKKTGSGFQILMNPSHTYSQATFIEDGTLCGDINFAVPLSISSPGIYRLAYHAAETTGGLIRTLSAPLTGTGTLNLIDGCLTLGVSSTFAGKFYNTNTTLQNNIMTLGANVLFDAGNFEHPITGVIQMDPSDTLNQITGFFPLAYWQASSSGLCGIDAPRSVSFRGIQGRVCYLTGTGDLYIKEGYTDASRIGKISYKTSEESHAFSGSIIKQGSGLQILADPDDPITRPTHSKETRIEQGILAGLLSPNAPLYIAPNASYQIAYPQNTLNQTGILSQTILGLRGHGTVALLGPEETLTIQVPNNVIENSEGTIQKSGTLRKTGLGMQRLNGTIQTKTLDVLEGTLALTGSLKANTVNISAATLEIATQHFEAVCNVIDNQAILHVTGPSVLTHRLDLQNDLSLISDADLEIAGSMIGAGTLQKKGPYKLTLGDIRSSATSILHVMDGVLCIANRASLGESMSVKLDSGTFLDLNSESTFRKLSGKGTVRMGTRSLKLCPETSGSLETPLQASDGLLTIYSENPQTITLLGTAMAKFKGRLAVTGKTNLSLQGTLNGVSVDIEESSVLESFSDQTITGISGSGIFKGHNTTLTLESDQAQTFTGNFQDTSLLLKGQQSFYWNATLLKSQKLTKNITITDQAKLIIGSSVVLNPEGVIHLNSPGSKLQLEGDQTLVGISGDGTLDLSQHTLTLLLKDNTIFSGDIIGDGTLLLCAEKPVSFIWEGATLKSFSGTLQADCNVTFQAQQSLLNHLIKIPFFLSGNHIDIQEDCEISIDQLYGNLTLNEHQVTLTQPSLELTPYQGWIKGGGCVVANWTGSFRWMCGLQLGSAPLQINIQSGNLVLDPQASLGNSSVSLYNGASAFILEGTQQIQGPLSFSSDHATLRTTATSSMLKNLLNFEATGRIETLGHLTLTEPISGTGAITKEGPGSLILQNFATSPRTWNVVKGSLQGALHADDILNLSPGTSLILNQDLTLRSLQSNNALIRFNHHNLTLNFSGTLNPFSWNDVGTLCVQNILNLGACSSALGHIILNGILTLMAEPQYLSLMGSGTVQQNALAVHIVADQPENFSGSFEGCGDLIKIGPAPYTLSGDYSLHTGLYTVKEGELSLLASTKLGNGLVQVQPSATLSLESGESIQSTLILEQGTLRITQPTTLSASLSIDQGTLDTQAAFTTSTALIPGKTPTLTKMGPGVWTLASDEQHPFSLRIQEGAFQVTGSLHPETHLDLKASTQTCFLNDQTLSSLTGQGTVQIYQNTLTLNMPDSTRFSGSILGNDLILTGGQTWTWDALNTGLTDSIQIDHATTLLSTLDQTFPGLCGKGTVDMDHHHLTLSLVKNVFFQGTLKNCLSINVKSEKRASLLWTGHNLDIPLTVATTCTLESPVQYQSLILEASGTIHFQQEARIESIAGQGSLSGPDLKVNFSPQSIFSGDIIGSGKLTIYGSGTWSGTGYKSFKGLCILTPHTHFQIDGTVSMSASLDVSSTLALNADQTFDSVEGEGKIVLNQRTLTLRPKDSTQIFKGDFENGTVILNSLTPWRWEGPHKLFNQVLHIMESSKAIISSPTRIEHTQIQLDTLATLQLEGPSTLTNWMGNGSIIADDVLDLRPLGQTCIFEGNIQGSSPLNLYGPGKFQWNYSQPLHTGGFFLKSQATLEVSEDLNPLESFFVESGSSLICNHDQTFQDLWLEGDLQTNHFTTTLTLIKDLVWHGNVSGDQTLVLSGNHTLTWAGDQEKTFAGTILFNDTAQLDMQAPLSAKTQIHLDSDQASMTLSCPQTILSMKGQGTVNLGKNSLTLSNGSSTFAGQICSGSLRLDDYHLTLAELKGVLSNPPIGSILLQNSSTLTVQRPLVLSKALTIQDQSLASFTKHATLASLQGDGSIQISTLCIKNQESMIWRGQLRSSSSGILILENLTPTANVTLLGDSSAFTGMIQLSSGVLQLAQSCRLKANLITIDHAEMRVNHAENSKGKWSIEGPSSIQAGSNVTLSPTILLQAASNLTLDTQPFSVQFEGPLRGQTSICKKGSGSFCFGPNSDLDYSGEFLIQEGLLEVQSKLQKTIRLSVQAGAEFKALKDFTCSKIEGTGTLLLARGVHLLLNQDLELQALIQGGTLSPHQLRVQSLLELEGLSVPFFVEVLPEASIGSNPDITVNGKLLLHNNQSVRSLKTEGTLLWDDHLILLGEACQSILKGFIQGPHMSVTKGAQAYLPQAVQIKKLDVLEGLVRSDNALEAAILTQVSLKGVFEGFGKLNRILWEGTVHPFGEKESLENPFGILSLQSGEIKESARLVLGINSGINGSINFLEAFPGLDHLTILFKPYAQTWSEIAGQTFTILKLPSTDLVDLPKISPDFGLGSLPDLPSDALQLFQNQNRIMLQISPISSNPDLRNLTMPSLEPFP